MQSSPANSCHHVRTSGVRCGSPALHDRRYCYYHQRSRPLLLNFARDNQDPVLFSLPVFEDAHAIQFTLRNVAHRLLDGTIDTKTAGLLFYALQIASSNLKHMKAEAPGPEQVVVEVPKASDLPRPTPTAEAVPLNPLSTRLSHFPETTPSIEDEYRDDVERQAREIQEELAFARKKVMEIHDEKPPESKAEDNLAQKREPESERSPNDGLPPGTIQARARRQRHRNRRGCVDAGPDKALGEVS
jgi:hypothetical protein